MKFDFTLYCHDIIFMISRDFTPPVAAEIFGKMKGATSSRGRSLLTMKINYAVILSRMRCAFELMRLTIRSWYSVF